MTFLEKACSALSDSDVSYAVVGGHAVALHGAVRGTVDVDIIISWSLSSLRRAEAALVDIGLVSRLPISAKDVYQFRDEYISKRNLVAWNFYNPNDLSEQLDLVIAADLKGRKTQRVKLPGGDIRILSRPDLIAMKKASGRPQDLEDVSALERLA
ncbi:MAG: hypothetical protein KJO85_07310 [Gammaproteobacteria bacterium]|nr:hypothetical protein [Gammaproteobacteria bacterium]